MFAFLTRWVPVEDRPASRPSAARAPERVAPNPAERWVKRGVAGVALLAASQWIWRASRSPAASGQTGEKPPERRS
jgi:hypothetical protein